MPDNDLRTHGFREEICSFARELFERWRWYSVTVLGSAGLAYWQGGGGVIPAWILWLIAISGIVVAAFLAWREQYRKVLSLQKRALDHRDKVLLECADRLKRGEVFLQALQGAKADELQSNDDLLFVCDALAAHGHENCFGDKGILFGIERPYALEILRHFRLKGIGHSEKEVYEFQVEVLLAAEKKVAN